MPIGKLCLILALPASFFSLFVSLLAHEKPKLLQMARRSSHLVTALVSIAALSLICAFATDNFQFEFVCSHSSRTLPLIYKLTALWSGSEGSLLFWLWILAVCASIVAFAKKTGEFCNINAVLQAMIMFFVIAIVFAADPFKLSGEFPLDGTGLKPILQNPFMIFHPPLIYLGYVGFSVPFAYALAALMEKDFQFPREWFREIYFWTIIPWIFLSAGNILGSMWANAESGWGGFWAWDPVQNAGILPWFTATAFLHSLAIQKQRGFFKITNLALAIATFLLTISGTFIARSGMFKSVHRFSSSTVGFYFIALLALAVLLSVCLLILRRRSLRAEKPADISLREGAFCLMSILLVFSMLVVLWGTILPLASHLIHGGATNTGPGFFNRHMAPVCVAILFLMGICPMTAWDKTNKKEIFIPLALCVLAGVLVFVSGIRKWFPLAVASGAAFVIAIIFIEFFKSSRNLAKRAGCGNFTGFLKLFRMEPKRCGGLIAHLGVVILFIGLAGNAYQSTNLFTHLVWAGGITMTTGAIAVIVLQLL